MRLTETLVFLGDVMLGRLVNEKLKSTPLAFVWGDTLPILKTAGASFINLETTITDWGEPVPAKTFCFRTDSKNVAALKVANVRAVSLANNHILDFGERGLKETIKNLKKAKIAFAGAGENLEAAQKPAFHEVDNLKIAFIAATDNEPKWEAKRGVPGVFFVPMKIKDSRFKKLSSLVATAKKGSDLVIVSLHWGPNWGYEPLKEHRTCAFHLIEIGAGIIFGHSPHVFRGIEIYKGKPILYSCGDFVDDYAVSEVERNDQSFIFQVHFKDNKIEKITLIPTIITNFHAQLAKGRDKEEICAKMIGLCGGLGTEAIRKDFGLEIFVVK